MLQNSVWFINYIADESSQKFVLTSTIIFFKNQHDGGFIAVLNLMAEK